MTRKERTKTLILKYLDNTCSELELKELLDMLKNDTADLRELDAATKELWEREQSVLNPEKEMLYQKQARQLLHQSTRTQKSPRLGWSTRARRSAMVAASIALLAIGGYYLVQGVSDNLSSKQAAYTSHLATHRGEIRRIELPDGTRITLNAASSLRYDSRYGKKERRVWLTGEAFFEVQPDPRRPFLVHSDKLDIRVLGTSFNIKDYPDDIQTAVTVRTGVVGVSCGQDNLHMNLKADDQLLMNKRNQSVSRIHGATEDPLSWMRGNLTFTQLPLSDAIKVLRRHYACDIVLQDTTSQVLLSGTHDNKSLESVLQSICFSAGLKYRKEGERYLIY